MAAKRRTTLVASKHSIALPFFPVKSKTAYFLRHIPPVFIGVARALLRAEMALRQSRFF